MERRRLDKLGLFQDLGYEPHEGQVAVHLSRAPRRVLVCGVRWGKTMCAAFEALAAAMEPAEESLGWVVAPSYDLCEQVMGILHRVVEEHLAHRIVPVRGGGRRILLRNMAGGLSEIRAKSADRPDSLLGEGLDWLVIDEAARLKRAIWEEHLSQRLVDRRGWALFVSTPSGPGWLYELWRRGGEDPRYASWNFPSWTNPHLDSGAVEEERGRLSEETFDQEFGAIFLGANMRPICRTCVLPEWEHPTVVLRAGEEMDRCPECGRLRDEDGLALGWITPEGELWYERVFIDPRSPEEQAAIEARLSAEPVVEGEAP